MTATPDALLLARLQFAANMSFHILFPAISIGLAWLVLYFRLRANYSGEARWAEAYTFWVKVVALTFALGVVSGVTMSFQFGTNWPGYMKTVGNIAGPLLSYEILFAFFLEAAFIGVMLFGGQRVSPRMHALAALLVALGTTISAFWILALDSWMQTPAGFTMIDGQAHVASWLAVIFNPSFPYRLTHMLLASGLTVAFLVAGISAYRWLRGQRSADVQAALRTAVRLAAVLIPLQIAAGDQHGLNTLEHQPAKIAAMEGLWQSARGAPMVLFGVPDETLRANRYEIAIPRLASIYLTHSLDGEIKGLDDFADHPPVAPVFFAFRVMVGMGMLMLFVSWLAAWKLRQGRADRRPGARPGRHDFRGLGCSAGRLVYDGSRTPALARDRSSEDRGRSFAGPRTDDRHHACDVRGAVRLPSRGVRLGSVLPRRQGEPGTRRLPGDAACMSFPNPAAGCRSCSWR